ncbi:MAG: hypothetical protein PWP64_1614 [Candidatus Cloacimonadota bacterium]|nr:hypothetical protein [Candidatus Cloacimonadota bacterium]
MLLRKKSCSPQKDICMKRFVFFALLLSLAFLLCAQQIEEIRTYQNLRFPGTAVQSTSGDNWVLWDENPGGDYQIRAQKFSSQAIPQFTEPITIPTAAGSKRLLQLVPSSDNGIVLLYMHEIEEDLPVIRVQKINSAGQPLWQEYGIAVGLIYDYKTPCIELCENNLGGAFVLYEDRDAESNGGVPLCGKNFDAEGNNIWSTEPAFHVTGFFDIRQLLLTDEGDLLISLESYNSNYIRKVDNFGNPTGADPLFSDISSLPLNAMMAKGTDGNILFYNGNTRNEPMQVQMMDSENNLLYPDLQELTMPLQLWRVRKVVSDAVGGFFFSYQTYPYTKGVSGELRVFHIDEELNLIASADTPILAEHVHYMDIDAQSDSAGNLWISFACNHFEEGTRHVSLAKLDSFCNPLFENLQISINDQLKHRPTILVPDSGAMLFWADHFEDNICQRWQVVDSNGNMLVDENASMLSQMLDGFATVYGVYSMGERSICLMHDYRFGKCQAYYQLLDSSLNQYLEPNGRALNPDSDLAKELWAAAVGDNGKLGIIYSQGDAIGYSYYFQQIDSSGNTLHPGGGILLDTQLGNDAQDAQLGWDQDSWYLFWMAGSNDDEILSQVRGQRILNGEPQWSSGGKEIVSYDDSVIAYLCGSGRYIVAEIKVLSSQDEYRAFYIQANGDIEPGWDPEGNLLTVSNINGFSHLFRDELGLIGDELYIPLLRIDLEDLDNQELSLRLIKISPDGTMPWENHGLSIAAMDMNSFSNISTVLYADEISLLYDDNQEGSYLHKIDYQGNPLFGSDGVLIPLTGIHRYGSRLVGYENGTYSFVAAEIGHDYNMLFQHTYINGGGSLQDTQTITESDITKLYAVNSDNHAILYWVEEIDDPFSLDVYWPYSIKAISLAEPVSIPDPALETVPALILNQNTPNPFSQSTRIAYKLHTASPVKIQIYNIKGQLVSESISSMKSSGEHEWIWNGKDTQGRSCATGVYFFKLRAGRYSSTKKMMLIR